MWFITVWHSKYQKISSVPYELHVNVSLKAYSYMYIFTCFSVATAGRKSFLPSWFMSLSVKWLLITLNTYIRTHYSAVTESEPTTSFVFKIVPFLILSGFFMLCIIWNGIEVQFLNLFKDTFQCFLLLETEMVICIFESVLWSSWFRMFSLLSVAAHNSSENYGCVWYYMLWTLLLWYRLNWRNK